MRSLLLQKYMLTGTICKRSGVAIGLLSKQVTFSKSVNDESVRVESLTGVAAHRGQEVYGSWSLSDVVVYF